MDGKILHTLDYRAIIDKLTRLASTGLGRAVAEALVPSSDLEQVTRVLQATDEAYAADRLKGAAPFGGIADIQASLKRAKIGGMLNPAELLDIANTVRGGRRVKRHIAVLHEDHPMPLLYAMADQLTEHRVLEEAILACIDDQAEVLDNASPELAAIRRELRGGEARVREKLESMIRSSSVQKMLQDAIITIRGDRYVIPVKSEYRNHFGGIIHDQSGSGATLFIEPEAVVQMNNRLRELRLNEEREIEKILHRLTAQTAEYADDLAIDLELLGQLDFTFAKARLAHEMKATLPGMNDRGFIKLKRGRHPLIDAEAVVPLDVELGNQYSTIIVTGPNTGGKTVSLKTIGLLSLMAMSGLFVPAEEGSELCVFDAIYADIGDEQSIEQSLSTFSSHLTNIIRILGSMTPQSLVLLDEVGAGTDPAEGSALAIAILEHMHQSGCRLVATTHYSELKAYAYNRQGVINASMEFDVQTLSPTYRLLVGVPGRSNAFAIAERLGLPRSIIEHARGEVSEEDMRVENMIASLEEDRLGAESERITATALREEMERLKTKHTAELRRFEEQRDRMLAKAQEEAREAVAKAKREAEQIVADLRKLAMEEGASVKEHKLIDARRRLDEVAPQLQKPKTAAARGDKPQKVEAGDEVMVYSLNQKGHVLERGAAEATVQLGIMKMKVRLDDLELIKAATNQSRQQPKQAASLKRTKDDTVRSELDLRGANLEEAIVEVDRFIDEAYLMNMGQICIIHGKGTGVLRSGIQDYLRKHRLVKTYRLGNYGEGGNGVTVAELK
ncbi:recombination and DNA strand exchange inhibitor protein [Paenibacillus darwinianus]|uniref:Endonuclease MutS2 n=1 Tax=Paenibacillus darwinianus TaxID=1380763 RepID=A0A9W5S1E2_9BACL|nr:endonuclease MutS2 [Paenibacillus darwinianus]EXX87925.1 recombination and DNA strand exchange inhibitor protein [Paenibacillus darwinianus]EXX88339.1 recombination and DNA strand exchange inhibitor protein [Paenibacillus darwinianus]EXX88363.1 recombination and DNA strand exchange inhibitor protein [Paenibacillus darwinianus]